jgi:hypothetical protein
VSKVRTLPRWVTERSVSAQAMARRSAVGIKRRNHRIERPRGTDGSGSSETPDLMKKLGTKTFLLVDLRPSNGCPLYAGHEERSMSVANSIFSTYINFSQAWITRPSYDLARQSIFELWSELASHFEKQFF